MPHFLLFLIVVVFFWGNIFKRKGKLQDINLNGQLKKKINLINRYIKFYKIILILYALIIFVFIFLPDFYNHFFYPIEEYNNPNINGVGFHLLKIVFVWFIAVQVYIDRLLLKKSFDSFKTESLLFKAYGLLFIGMFLLFVFYTLIVTDFFTLTLLIVSIVILIVQKSITILIPVKIDS